MILNKKEIFLERQAYNGNGEAAWQLVKHYLKIDAVKCAEFARMVADYEPAYCEQKLEEYFGEPIEYEDMLGIIIVGYQLQGDEEMADKWVQKYADYIEMEYAALPEAEREEKKAEIYQYRWMKEQGEIDRFENRFLFKWEADRYLKGIKNAVQNGAAMAVSNVKARSVLSRLVSKLKNALAL